MNHLDRLPEIARKYHTARVFDPENPLGTHNYMPTYQKLLANRPIHKILEIGIGPKGLAHVDQPAGCGLLMWSECFPEAQIFGLDNNEETLVNRGNIQSILCDQSKERDLRCVRKYIGPDIDLIVDDASHVAADQILTMLVFLPLLSPTGVYVIEDVKRDSGLIEAMFVPHEVIENVGQREDSRLVVIEARDL